MAPQRLSADDAWGITPQDREACRDWIRGLRNEGIFTPPSVQGSLAVPGHVGGMNWSGYAFDPDHNLLIVNSNNLPAKVQLIPRQQFNDPARRIEKLGMISLAAAGAGPGHPYYLGYRSEMGLLLNAHPRIGPAFGALFTEVMFAPGSLSRAEREMIAATAAAAQDCHY